MVPPKTPKRSAAAAGGTRLSPWLAPNPAKRWTELFFLAYSPSWIIWCLCILVPFKIYEVPDASNRRRWRSLPCLEASHGCPPAHPALPPILPALPSQRLDEWGYLSLGLIAAPPCVLLPLALQPPAERGKPLAQRYWVKANLWIAIFSFIGNYFWTHYFYRLLGAAYTFPAHRLNQAWPGLGGGVGACGQGAVSPAASNFGRKF
jgi:cycloeucalenol cycloisomerase